MATDKVRFVSKYRKMKVLLSIGKRTFALDATTGNQIVHEEPDRVARFENHIFETSDEWEIKTLKSHSAFTGVREDGQPDRKVVFEAEIPDPNIIKLHQALQNMPTDVALQRIMQPQTPEARLNYGAVNQVQAVQDPAVQTAQAVLQEQVQQPQLTHIAPQVQPAPTPA